MMEILKKFEEENQSPSDEDEDEGGKESDLAKRLEAVELGTLLEQLLNLFI